MPSRWFGISAIFYCLALGAAPPELFNQRSQPMGTQYDSSNKLQAVPLVQQSYYLSDIPPRFQWFNYHGYCGETSLVSAGLKFGQYVSQYAVRQLIVGGGTQATEQVLLGSNAASAADQLHLGNTSHVGAVGQTGAFLNWVKAYILNECPVIIGVYTNENLFYNHRSCGSEGDPEYDHIVPVLAIKSFHSLDPPTLPPSPLLPYYGDDRIVFSDNGLQGPVDNPTNAPCPPNPADPYTFEYSFDGFQKTREKANCSDGPWYSIASAANTHAIAILGVKDLNDDTIPIVVSTNKSSGCTEPGLGQYVNFEYPEISTLAAPTPMPLSLVVTVSIPDTSQSYNLYLYTDLTLIPDSQFNMNAGNAAMSWVIPANSGNTYVLNYNIQSDQVAAFRAVSTSAP